MTRKFIQLSTASDGPIRLDTTDYDQAADSVTVVLTLEPVMADSTDDDADESP